MLIFCQFHTLVVVQDEQAENWSAQAAALRAHSIYSYSDYVALAVRCQTAIGDM